MISPTSTFGCRRRVAVDGFDRVDELRHGPGVEHAREAHRLVERGLEKVTYIHHTLVLDILDDLVDELDLLLVQRGVVDELGEDLHDRLMVQLDYLADHDTEVLLAVLTDVIILGPELLSEDACELRHIVLVQRDVAVKLVDHPVVAVIVNVSVDLVMIVLEIVTQG